MEVDGEATGGGHGGGEANGEKEGRFLLGPPTFEDIGNGRFRCLETGHELPAREAEAYGRSKGCRVALIDSALARKKAPLNMFKQDPLCKSKLICKLTGDNINKSEEHIWKHISGKRFLNKLKQKEVESIAPSLTKKSKKVNKKADPTLACSKKGQKDNITEEPSEEKESMVNGDGSEELEFWMPPVGDRWDFDDGKDRWESCTSSDPDPETDDDVDTDGGPKEDNDIESADLSACTKRMSIALGPSSFASRKKKSRKEPVEHRSGS